METGEKLKKILVEWHQYQIPPLYPRHFDKSLSSGNEILSIIGARRSGKTFLCYQIIQELRAKHPADNVMYVNLEDERLHPLNGDELSLLWDTYLEVFAPDLGKPVTLFVDEIQNAGNWSKWARRITEQNHNLKLVITGSSSRMLSRDIATELRGRTLSFTVYPLSFREYLNAKKISLDLKQILYAPSRFHVKRQFNAYFKVGGFPATLTSEQPEQLLKEYYRVMFYRDLVERYKVKNIKLLEDYLTLLLDQVACHYSVSATASKLAEFGYSLSKNTLTNFTRYAQDAFLFFEATRHSYKGREQLRAPRKIYSIDHGLVQAVRFSFSEDYGRMMENIVFLSLKRQGFKIYYHKGNRECDFLAEDKGKIIQAIQVTKTLSQSKTKNREIEGLLEALSIHGLKEGLILTQDTVESHKVGDKTIRTLPLWYWLLTLS